MSNLDQTFGQTDIVKLSDEDADAALIERAVGGLWDVVNDLTRLRRTSRQNYRVTIMIIVGTIVCLVVSFLAAAWLRRGVT